MSERKHDHKCGCGASIDCDLIACENCKPADVLFGFMKQPAITDSVSSAGERETISAWPAGELEKQAPAHFDEWGAHAWACGYRAALRSALPGAAASGREDEAEVAAFGAFVRRFAPPTSDALRGEWMRSLMELLARSAPRPGGQAAEAFAAFQREPSLKTGNAVLAAVRERLTMPLDNEAMRFSYSTNEEVADALEGSKNFTPAACHWALDVAASRLRAAERAAASGDTGASHE